MLRLTQIENIPEYVERISFGACGTSGYARGGYGIGYTDTKSGKYVRLAGTNKSEKSYSVIHEGINLLLENGWKFDDSVPFFTRQRENIRADFIRKK